MRKFLAVAGVVAAVTAATAAQAVVVPFGGSKTGTDPLGETWSTTNVTKSSWGEPGLGRGVLTFNPHDLSSGHGNYATEFDFIFLKGVKGVISKLGGNASFTGTRFEDVTTGTFWTADYVSPQEVDFFAPHGSRINPGDKFFVNVAFTGPVSLSKFSFAGLWTDAGVPEPGTWGLMIAGLGLMGMALRSRRSASLAV